MCTSPNLLLQSTDILCEIAINVSKHLLCISVSILSQNGTRVVVPSHEGTPESLWNFCQIHVPALLRDIQQASHV